MRDRPAEGQVCGAGFDVATQEPPGESLRRRPRARGGARRRGSPEEEGKPTEAAQEEALRQVRRAVGEVLEEAHSRATAVATTKLFLTTADGRGLGALGGHDAPHAGQGAGLF